MGRVAKAAPADIVGARRISRQPARGRQFRTSGTADAAALIGDLALGDEICGVTNGQFSLIDILEHLLTQTGPADVTVATWTMGIYDGERAWSFVENRAIRRIRFVLDPSMFSRRPELAAVLVRSFGVEAFRGVNCHAKFATVRGERLAVAVRSSMNLNPNNRLECFDLSVDDATARFFEDIVDEIWRKIPTNNESQAAAVFRSLFDAEPEPRRGVMANPFLAAG